jgi:hypothetical protein
MGIMGIMGTRPDAPPRALSHYLKHIGAEDAAALFADAAT